QIRSRFNLRSRWSTPRRPGLVVAGGLGPAALGERRAGGAVGARSAGEIGAVRLPPRPRRHLVLGRGTGDRWVQPAVPGRRPGRGFSHAIVDHPSSLVAERRIDLATLGAVVAVAELVLADEFAVERGPGQRAERRSVPPGEKPQQEILH